MNNNLSDAKGPHGFTGPAGNGVDGGSSSAEGDNCKVQGVKEPFGPMLPGVKESFGPMLPGSSGFRIEQGLHGSVGLPGDSRNRGKRIDVNPRGGPSSEAMQTIPISAAILGLMNRVATLEKQVVDLRVAGETSALNNYRDSNAFVRRYTPALLCLCSTIDLDRLNVAQREMLRQSLSPQALLMANGDSIISSRFFQSVCNAFLNAGISLHSRTQIIAIPTGINKPRLAVARPQDLGFWNYWNYLANDPFVDFQIRIHARFLCNSYCGPIHGMRARQLDNDVRFYIYTTVMEVYRYLA